jgi:quercetin dioxygenase-like cupin family protein
MKKDNLKNMVRGWFCGRIEPCVLSSDFEVAVKRYKKGDFEAKHVHKISTEITVIVSGEVEMNGIKYIENDIITIPPGAATDFLCLTDDVITCVVKSISAPEDKYIVEEE